MKKNYFSCPGVCAATSGGARNAGRERALAVLKLQTQPRGNGPFLGMLTQKPRRPTFQILPVAVIRTQCTSVPLWPLLTPWPGRMTQSRWAPSPHSGWVRPPASNPSPPPWPRGAAGSPSLASSLCSGQNEDSDGCEGKESLPSKNMSLGNIMFKLVVFQKMK